jgi:hypothetical protein
MPVFEVSLLGEAWIQVSGSKEGGCLLAQLTKWASGYKCNLITTVLERSIKYSPKPGKMRSGHLYPVLR